MRVALSLAGTDAGRSGLGVYLSSILPSGTNLVAVRAFDQAGNFVVRDIEVK